MLAGSHPDGRLLIIESRGRRGLHRVQRVDRAHRCFRLVDGVEGAGGQERSRHHADFPWGEVGHRLGTEGASIVFPLLCMSGKDTAHKKQGRNLAASIRAISSPSPAASERERKRVQTMTKGKARSVIACQRLACAKTNSAKASRETGNESLLARASIRTGFPSRLQ